MAAIARDRLETLRFFLNEVFMLGMMAVIAAILTAAMVMQYGHGELPCPLCLLQRAAMFGVCFGLMQNFRHGFSDRNLGYSLLFSAFLLIVAVRLGGVYHNGNDKHLPTDLLRQISLVGGKSVMERLARREYALLAIATGATLLAMLPLLLHAVGTRWRTGTPRS